MTETKDNLQHQADHEKARSGHSVLLYLVVLFAAALVLLILAYCMQQRSNQAAMNNLEQTSFSAEQSVEQLSQQNIALQEQVEELQTQIESLQTQLEDANEVYESLDAQYKQNDNTLLVVKSLYTAELLVMQADYEDAAAQLTDEEFTKLIYEYENEADSFLLNLWRRYQSLVFTMQSQGYLSDVEGINAFEVNE